MCIEVWLSSKISCLLLLSLNFGFKKIFERERERLWGGDILLSLNFGFKNKSFERERERGF